MILPYNQGKLTKVPSCNAKKGGGPTVPLAPQPVFYLKTPTDSLDCHPRSLRRPLRGGCAPLATVFTSLTASFSHLGLSSSSPTGL